jgi:hypothetical protein
MAAKRSEAERQARLLRAYQLLCDCTPHSYATSAIAKEFKVSLRTAQSDCVAATELIRDDFNWDRNFIKNAALEKRYRLLMQAEKDGDIKLALAILDSTAKIQGLFHLDANTALSMLRDEYGLVVIDPKLDNFQLIQKLYEQALERKQSEPPQWKDFGEELAWRTANGDTTDMSDRPEYIYYMEGHPDGKGGFLWEPPPGEEEDVTLQ